MKKHFLTLTSLAAALLFLAGCAENTSSSSAPGTSPNHAAEAERNITADNMDQHLESLEAEITADEASQEP